MKNIENKIYALKDGDHPGIYMSWLDFYPEAEKLELFYSKSFEYQESLIEEPATVLGSLRWAILHAKEYLGDANAQIYGEYPCSADFYETEEEEKLPFDNEEEDWDFLEDDEEDLFEDDTYTSCVLPTSRAPEELKEQEKQIRKALDLDEKYCFGSPWLDMILAMEEGNLSSVTGDEFGNKMGFVGRYFPPVLYYRILYAVLEPKKFIDEYFQQKRLLSSDADWESPEEVQKSILYEFTSSEEYKTLSAIFYDENDMTSLDLAEVKYRCCAAAKNYRNTWVALNSKTVDTMKAFLESGKHTLLDVYVELTENGIYKKELHDVSGPFYNPDLERENAVKTEDMTLEEIVLQTKKISTALKEHIVGQDGAIDKFEEAFFHGTKNPQNRKGPRNVFLFAGPSGVGKTYMAETFAKTLDLPYKRFDMSSFANRDSLEELEGISTFWKSAKPGTITSYVAANPKCVILFDEIEKAASEVVRMFLQILDEGVCFDRYYDRNIDFHNCILIFTTNAGRQLYQEAQSEDLSQLSNKVIIDALEKDVKSDTNVPYFPPELISRFSSNTIIMFNHLGADAIRKVIQKDVDQQIQATKEKYGIDVSKGKDILAATVQYAIGGKQDARNASKISGKLLDKELYELFMLVEEKVGLNNACVPKKVEFQCDFKHATQEIRDFYSGERNGMILVFARDMFGENKEKVFLKNHVEVCFISDRDEYMKMMAKNNVLFSVIDFNFGRSAREKSLDISNVQSAGSKLFFETRKENASLPIYLLLDESQYDYSEREKHNLLSFGAKGFLDSRNFYKELQRCYSDICCIRAVDTLSVRHQVLTYETRKKLDFKNKKAKIIFYNLKFEMAIEAEDKNALITDEIKPDKKWSDIFVSSDVREELQFFIQYLRNPNEFRQKGVRPPKGALMYGPPGTGKTSLAKVVATESDVNFLSVSADELISGGAAKVHEVFRIARKYAPAVLFIDELDAVGSHRNMIGFNPALNALLVEIDGFANMDEKPVFVMAATNLQGNIDEALVRRFDRTFCVDLPKKEGRQWILEKLINAHENLFHISAQEVENLIERSVGMSPAKLENIVEAALREGIRSNAIVDDEMLDAVFEKCRYGEENTKDSEKEVRHTAYHEAGHALIHLHYGNVPDYMSVVARENFNGYVKPEKVGEHPSKEKLLQIICMSLGGRAAEQEAGYGLTPGASGDLQQATDLAKQMVCLYGMYEQEVGLAVISEEELLHFEKARLVINRILSEQLQQARQIIRNEREMLDTLVQKVLSSKKKYLTKKELEEIYHAKDTEKQTIRREDVSSL